MIDRLRRLVDPAHAACLAVLLVAIGIEVSDDQMRHILEIAAAIVAVIGFFLRIAPSQPAAKLPLSEPPNRQRT